MFAVACVFLSRWQFDRRAEVVTKNNLISQNYPMNPLPVSTLFPDGRFVPANEWRSVELHGHYIQGSGLLVRNKPYAGNQGFLQVGLFQADDLSIYLVDRGWLPTGSENDTPDTIPALPTGALDVVARVRATEPLGGKDASDGQLPAINPALAAKQLKVKDRVVDEFYLRLASENPPSSKSPMIEVMPELSEGNHLSYAIQWIMFAILAFVTLGYFVRQEREHYLAATDPNHVPKQKRKRHSDGDNEAEDAE
jgi:cytochrome oxidase assembly protein ShyY1